MAIIASVKRFSAHAWSQSPTQVSPSSATAAAAFTAIRSITVVQESVPTDVRCFLFIPGSPWCGPRTAEDKRGANLTRPHERPLRGPVGEHEKPRPLGACFRSVSYCEIRKVSRETRSRSYAKCIFLNVLVGRFNLPDGLRLGGTLPIYNSKFTARTCFALRRDLCPPFCECSRPLAAGLCFLTSPPGASSPEHGRRIGNSVSLPSEPSTFIHQLPRGRPTAQGTSMPPIARRAPCSLPSAIGNWLFVPSVPSVPFPVVVTDYCSLPLPRWPASRKGRKRESPTV